VITYVEHKNKNFKRVIDPATASQRKLRAWLRSIEADFADKVIDQKIKQLDDMINNTDLKETLSTKVEEKEMTIEQDGTEKITDRVTTID